MTTPRKWRLHANRGPRGKRYGKYLDKVVIIAPKTKHGPTHFVVTPATADLLGNPDKVFMLSDSNGNIGIKPAPKNDPQYDAAYRLGKSSTSKGNLKTTCRYIACKNFLVENDIHLNAVYSIVSVENDIVIFDLTSFEPLKFVV